MADAGPANRFSAVLMEDDGLKSEDSTAGVRVADLDVSFVLEDPNFKYFNYYFHSAGVLYLFKEADDSIHFFYRIDTRGKRTYFLCRNDQLFKFRLKQEDRIYQLLESEEDYCDQSN